MGTGEFTAWVTLQWTSIPSIASCYGNRDKVRPDGPLGLYADFTIKRNKEENTVEPLLSGHPRGNGNWSLNRYGVVRN